MEPLKLKMESRIFEVSRMDALVKAGISNAIHKHLAVHAIDKMVVCFGTLDEYMKTWYHFYSRPQHVRNMFDDLIKAESIMGKVSTGDLPSEFVLLRDLTLSQFDRYEKEMRE